MPRSSADKTIHRHWQLLKLLPVRGQGITVTALHERLSEAGFDVTKRTVERDLIDLSAKGGFSITCDEAKPQRWRWREGAKTEIGGMDVADALSLALAETAIAPLLPAALLRGLQPRFALARAKLGELKEHAYTRWLDSVRSVPATLALQAPAIATGVLETAQNALLEGTCLEIDYTSPDSAKTKTLPVHPLGYVQRGPVAYLVASAYDYDEPRLYAMHRIRRSRLTDQPRRNPPGFTLDAYIKAGNLDFSPGAQIVLKAHLSDALAILLSETPLSEDQDITGKPGDYHLTATIRDSWQLHFWILSQGPAITIKSPSALRHAILAAINETCANYTAT